jgi:CRP-like cAMP-binding protein/polyferredoxin
MNARHSVLHLEVWSMSKELTNQGPSSVLLGDRTVRFLRYRGVETELPEGEVIIRRGQEGRAFYVVLEGEVEVRLEHGDGTHLPLGRLGPGASFGELSALRKTPASADVVAVTPVRLLAYPAEHLSAALSECEPLRRKVMANLADNLQRTTASTWELFKHAKVLSSHGEDGGRREMMAASARMRAVRQQIDRFAASDEPVLIAGSPGTGKLLAAMIMHQGSSREEGPLIVIDCAQLPRGRAVAPLFGSALHAESEQVEGLGAVHLAHGGTLILRNLDQLEAGDQQVLADHLEQRRAAVAPQFPDIRLIATARQPERLINALKATLGQGVELPPLAQRRRDILPLARHLLHQAAPKGEAPELSKGAEHALLARTYQHHNVAELKEVVELATRCATGAELREEHIFSGISSTDASFGWAFPGQEQLRRLLRRGWLNGLRILVLVSFCAVIGLCLAAGESRLGRLANGFIWSAWEPMVFALFLLVGSVWCTVCPLSTAGRLMQRCFSLKRAAPSWSRSHGPWLAAFGFLLIVWIELRFDAVANPLASGLLLLGLIITPMILCAIYRREVWCRDLCPLGRLAEVLAPAAPLALAAQRSVCASSCTTHDCFKGNDQVPGCTVYHHPQQANEAHRCKMCLDCLVACPNDSVRLYLRPPLQGVWKLDLSAARLIPFATGLLLLTVVMLATQQVAWLRQPLVLTAAALGGLLAGMLLGSLLGLVLPGREDPGAAALPRLALGLMVLAWGVLMAYQLSYLPGLTELSLSIEPGFWGAGLLPATIPLITIGKLCLVLGAALATALIMLGIRMQLAREGGKIHPLGWLLVAAVALNLVIIAMVL